MTVPVMQSPAEISQRLLTPGQAPFLGVVMLDTRFPRPVGDLGNLATWPVPVNIRVVRGVWPDKVVQSATGLHAGRVSPAFAAIVRSLAREGAQAVTTTCGFLVLLQKELQAAAKVPVITSSLILLPKLLAAQPRVQSRLRAEPGYADLLKRLAVSAASRHSTGCHASKPSSVPVSSQFSPASQRRTSAGRHSRYR